MFAVFSAIKTASELSGSHNRPFLGSAASNAVKRHGPAEVTRERIFAWPCGDASVLQCFRLCRTSTSVLFNYITHKSCLFALLYADTNILFFLRLNSYLHGSKQSRRRGPFHPITPHSPHVLVKQSFLNEGAVVYANGDAFA